MERRNGNVNPPDIKHFLHFLSKTNRWKKKKLEGALNLKKMAKLCRRKTTKAFMCKD